MSEQRIADLVGHHVEIIASCGCTKVTSFGPLVLMDRLGPDATLDQAKARLRCRTCRQRPRLVLDLAWGVSGTRDKRVKPPPLPAWAKALLGR